MRQLHLTLLSLPYLLPLAEALSLANFQPLTSTLIPTNCQSQYGAQIPNCTPTDFAGPADCSQSCQKGLLSIAKSVNSACKGTIVSSTTLLGVVLDGNIIQGLCPGASAASASKPSSADASYPSSTTKDSKSKTTSQTSTSDVSPTTSSTSSDSGTTTSQASATTAQPATSAESNASTKATKSSASSTSKKTQSTPATKPATGGSGGGSPFDIASDASPSNLRPLMCTLGVALMVGILLGR